MKHSYLSRTENHISALKSSTNIKKTFFIIKCVKFHFNHIKNEEVQFVPQNFNADIKVLGMKVTPTHSLSNIICADIKIIESKKGIRSFPTIRNKSQY